MASQITLGYHTQEHSSFAKRFWAQKYSAAPLTEFFDRHAVAVDQVRSIRRRNLALRADLTLEF